jgi:hypothetical protein
MTVSRHTLNLGRDQRVDVRDADGNLRMIADHPLNAPIIGVGREYRLLRTAELDIAAGDRTLVVYAAQAGKEIRAASAVVMLRGDGVLSLTCWQVEPGFVHQRELADGQARHRIVSTKIASAVKQASTPAAALVLGSAFRKELR